MKKKKLTFIAHDTNNKAHSLHVFVDVINCGTAQDPFATIEGMKSICTSDGEIVNRIEQGRYQLVRTDELLFSTDPLAP